jgi:glutamate-1-semialdehyde aminotransferase
VHANADRIAGVLVEPIQSRNPEFRPRDFVKELRRITAECGSALILDEVVTGFRVAPGGVQEIWGIRADLATYGKLVAGGMPIGVLAGASRFMDALDGGHWSFGVDSQPEVPPTFFAGTFVRHPLALAATAAVLDHLEGDGRALFERVAPRTHAHAEAAVAGFVCHSRPTTGSTYVQRIRSATAAVWLLPSGPGRHCIWRFIPGRRHISPGIGRNCGSFAAAAP